MRIALAATFTLGALLMLVFEHTLARITGLALLFAFIALGVWAVARPGYLAALAEDPQQEQE